MKYYSRGLGLQVLFLLIIALFSFTLRERVGETAELKSPQKAPVAKAFGQLPLSFEANQGQTNKQVRFLSRGRGYNLYLMPTEAVLSLNSSGASEGQEGGEIRARMSMRLVGANPSPLVEGVEELAGKYNYFIGNDPSKWRTNVPTYAKVRYRNIYPGVDCIYYGKEDQLEFDLVLAPGADPKSISISFDGTAPVEINSEGALILKVAGEEIRLREPKIFQDIEGESKEIAGTYRLISNHEVGFDVGAYDPTRALTIDPVVVYATWLGGSWWETSKDIAVDAAGNAYVLGYTESTDFPTANPFQTTGDKDKHAFVSKFNAEGTELIYSTYLGGDGREECWAIEVDASGSAYIAGYTEATDFPLAIPLQSTMAGKYDVFVTKLDPTGSALVFSTYFGGTEADRAYGLALGASGSIFFAGNTQSTDYPTKNAFQSSHGGASAWDYDGFVTDAGK